MSPRLANLLLLFAGAVWGMGFIAQETAMEDMGPFLFTGLRFLLAGVVVLPFALREQVRARKKFSPNKLLLLLPVGIIFFIALVLQQIGLLTTSVTNAGFLTALYVILVPLISLIFLGEKPTLIIWPASLIALGGIFLLSGGELSTLAVGDWLVIVGAVFGAVHVILISRVGKALRQPFTMAAAQFFISGILGIIGYLLAPALAMPEPAISWHIVEAVLPEIAYAGIFSGALAFSLMAIGQQYTDASSAAIFLSSESLFAALFAAILLEERLGNSGYFGCAMIFAALLLVEINPGIRKRTSALP